ncbi:MAG: hypothetical protein V2I46_06045 [Bacteroides sp.]|nr:hypothetical protein [Bacteroides sp.]
MRSLMILALALVWGTGILAQEVARGDENDKTAKAVPTTIGFQGRLHDSGGSPVNANLNITFAIYDLEAGGVPFWAETHTAVEVSDGLFQVTLGTFNPLSPDFFAESDSRWLGIQVGSEAEMSPRTKFSSVAYALQSGDASNVWTLSGDHIYYNAGNVGIGTTIPAALLHAYGTGTGEGNVLFAGGFKLTDPGEPPATGVGTRMMWYPDKAAFRAGYVSGSQWDQANTGFFSVAMGYSTTASGDYSTAMGRNTIASGKFSSASGFYTIAPSYMETAIGRYNSEYSPYDPNGWMDTDRLFVIGNGASSSLRNNALTILKNGNAGFGTANPTALLHTYGTDIGEGNVLFVGTCKYTEKNAGAPPASGGGTRMMWYPDKAAFRAGEAYNTGWDAENIGYFSTAFGQATIASGHVSTALGVNTIASGIFSFAVGAGSTASGNSSIAMGVEVNAVTRNETAIGSYTTNYTPSSINDWVGTDRLFSIGNGLNESTRSNALTILKNGNTGIGIDNPENKLEVGGQVKITGGSPGKGKVLTSDANGLASWETIPDATLSLPFNQVLSFSEGEAFKITNTAAGAAIGGASLSGNGIVGETNGTDYFSGVFGYASLDCGLGIGIRGKTNSGSGYSGYFEGGNFYVSGNVGIGTSAPTALLQAYGIEQGQGNVLFVGAHKPTDPGNPPVSGAGTRMMWYPDKAAFRAGVVNGTQWDIDNIGDGSTAMGSRTIASGESSTAMGSGTIASGEASTAMGLGTTASEISSFAMGFGTEATGISSTAMGYSSIASGHTSTAIGYFTNASGNNSTALGNFTNAPSAFETVIGTYNTAYTPASINSWNAADRLFVIGNGTSSALSNAMTVLKNGNVGIGTSSPANALSVMGQADISSRLVVGSSTQAGRLLVANADGAGNALKIGTAEGDFANLYFLSSGLIFDCYRASDARRQPILLQPNGGKVGVGTTNPAYAFDVTGDIRATGSVYYGGTAGSANGSAYTKPDFVFEESYEALSPIQVEEFLLKEKHLPWITSAEQEKQENGEVTDMTRMAFETVETVENLQLQIIEQQKIINALLMRIEALERERSDE